ncbi:hypothetical protein B0H14DRAFT_2619406 [Mycena olivaceomarginata]|nr:hypothetical protein B0H14DRAFT_2619406 [Mycena olivaceomarginata]
MLSFFSLFQFSSLPSGGQAFTVSIPRSDGPTEYTIQPPHQASRSSDNSSETLPRASELLPGDIGENHGVSMEIRDDHELAPVPRREDLESEAGSTVPGGVPLESEVPPQRQCQVRWAPFNASCILNGNMKISPTPTAATDGQTRSSSHGKGAVRSAVNLGKSMPDPEPPGRNTRSKSGVLKISPYDTPYSRKLPKKALKVVWYQSVGPPIEEPPVVPPTIQPPVSSGALYMHWPDAIGGSCLIWIRDSDNRSWIRIEEGHVHIFGDTTYHLTLGEGKPSWVQPNTYYSRRRLNA